MHQGDQEHHGGKSKTKAHAKVPETINRRKDNDKSIQPKLVMYIG